MEHYFLDQRKFESQSTLKRPLPTDWVRGGGVLKQMFRELNVFKSTPRYLEKVVIYHNSTEITEHAICVA